MGWREHRSINYAEINPKRTIQCCLSSKAYKGFAPANLRILCDAKILRRKESMQNLLMQWYVMAFTWNLYNPYVFDS